MPKFYHSFFDKTVNFKKLIFQQKIDNKILNMFVQKFNIKNKHILLH